MTPNEQIIELLDKVSNPYDNDIINALVKKLIESGIFNVHAVEDLTQYLISKKGQYDLVRNYTRLDFQIIEDFVK